MRKEGPGGRERLNGNIEAAEPTAPPNRQQRRRLAQLRSMREKEEARLGQPAMAA
jgi:hypothetical protein